jgi:WD40 repeat protein
LIPTRHALPLPAATNGKRSPDHQRLGNGTPFALAWRADSTVLAVGGSLGIFLYTPALRGLAHLDGSDAPVTALAWHPDGTQIASVSRDRMVQLWEVTSGKVHTLLTLPPSGLDLGGFFFRNGYQGAVSYRPDGAQFATATFDNKVRIWDSQTGRLAYDLVAEGPVYYVAWHPDGKRLAVSGTHTIEGDSKSGRIAVNYLQVWDVTTGKVLASADLRGHLDPWEPIHLGQWTANGRGIHYDDGFWAVDPGATDFRTADFFVAGGGDFLEAAYSADGRAWAAGTASFSAYCDQWNGSSVHIVTPTLDGDHFTGYAAPRAMAWSPDGHFFAVLDGQGKLSIIDGTGRLPASALSDPFPQVPVYAESTVFADLPTNARWASDGKHLIFTDYHYARGTLIDTVFIKDVVNGQTLQTVNFNNILDSLPIETMDAQTIPDLLSSSQWYTAFSPNGKRLAVSSQTNIVVIDVVTQRIVRRFKAADSDFSGCPRRLALYWSPDSTQLATFDNAVLTLWRPDDDRRTVVHRAYPGVIAWSPDSRYVFLYDSPSDSSMNPAAQSPRIIDAATGQTVAELTTISGKDIRSVVWAVDAQQIAFLTRSGSVQVWDVASRQQRWELPARQIAWSSDGKHVASLTHDGQVWLYDKAGSSVRQKLDNPDHVVLVAFSPDGKRLATASEPGTIQVWEVTTGNRLVTLSGHQGPVTTLLWKPDNRQIMSRGDDGTLRIWTLK